MVADAELMRLAIGLARQGRHTAHPNPMVGAVIVADGRVVGDGYHHEPGAPHAERLALDAAGENARGATAYVTLEPCNHTGRTPPCVDALIASGVQRVVFAAPDPDEKVCGRGGDALESAGISVEGGLLRAEAEAVDPGYFIHRRLGRPMVRYKAAMTLDGRTAAPDGTSKWISGRASRECVHEMRASSDAIAVGAGTVQRDDPALTCRLEGYAGKPPLRVVFDRSGRVRAGARVLDDEAETVVFTTEAGAANLVAVREEATEVVVTDAGNGELAYDAALRFLAERGVVDLLVEGGARTARCLLDQSLIDRVRIFLGPMAVLGNDGTPLFGGESTTSLDLARRFTISESHLVGGDVMVDAVPIESNADSMSDVEESGLISRSQGAG